jgi:hypothetical protein
MFRRTGPGRYRLEWYGDDYSDILRRGAVFLDEVKDMTSVLCTDRGISSVLIKGMLTTKAFNTTLTHMELSGMTLQAKGNVRDVIDFLGQSPCPPLESLDLSTNGIFFVNFTRLLKVLCSNTTLTRLVMRGVADVFHADPIVFPHGSSITGLTRLDIAKSHMRSETFVGFCEMMCGNSSITHLDISGCTMGDDFPDGSFVTLVERNATLSHLIANDLTICGPGFTTPLAHALSLNKGLKTFSMDNNYMNAEELSNILNGLTFHPKIRKLHFSNVRVDDIVLITAAQLISGSKKLRVLNLTLGDCNRMLFYDIFIKYLKSSNTMTDIPITLWNKEAYMVCSRNAHNRAARRLLLASLFF